MARLDLTSASRICFGPPRLNFYLNVLSYLPESTIVCNCADYKNFYTCNKDFINRRSI